MMMPRDSLVLAVTKLKTRKIRLFVTVFIASLLFIILSVVSVVMNGALNSVEDFSNEGLGKRYLVQAGDVVGFDYTIWSDVNLIAQAKADFSTYKAQRAAEAKKLGIDYDPLSEQQPFMTDPNGQETLDTSSPIVKNILLPKIEESGKQYYEKLNKTIQKYQTVGSYSSVSFGSQMMADPIEKVDFGLSLISDGVEKVQDTSVSQNPFELGLSSVQSGLNAMSDEVLRSFLLPNKDFRVTDSRVPIVAPYTAVEQVLGLKQLPVNASPSERIDRLKEIREKASDVTFTLCSRNQTSLSRQQQATTQQAEINANKGKKGFKMPDLVYAVSSDPCQDVITTRDVRSAEEKKLTQKQQQFDAKFGKYTDPQQRQITFTIVGISPDPPSFESFKFTDMLGSLLRSNIGTGWMVPLSAKDQFPEFLNQINKIGTMSSYTVSDYIEFADAATARTFIEKEACDTSKMGFPNPETIKVECAEHPFFLSPFGSSSIALEQVRTGFTKYFTIALLVIALISVLIMMGTIGKIIADSRRETAVFRAIGAKRLDIAQIYITYALLLGVIIITFSLCTGWLISLYVQSKYGAEFTINALVAFNASDLSREFSLSAINVMQLLQLAVIVLVGCVFSASIPLLSNIRRNPIKDMRDER